MKDANGNVLYSFSYDGVGNFKNNATLGAANSVNEYSNLAYDPRHNLTNDGTDTYTYDALSRLIGVAPDSPTSGSLSAQYGYDGQGRMAWEDVYTWSGSWVLSTTYHFAWNGDELVAKLDANNQILQQYTWGPGQNGTNEVVALTNYTTGGPQTYALVYDASGNVTMMVDPLSGSVVASYSYAPYGALVIATGPEAGICPLGFKGYWTDFAVDPNIGWAQPAIDYGTVRNDDFAIGKWMQDDPSGIDGGLNPSETFGGDPINQSDPSGLAPVSSSGGITVQLDEGPLTAFVNQLPAVDLSPADYSSLVMTGGRPGSLLPLPEVMARQELSAWSKRLVAANQQVVALQAIVPTLAGMNYSGAASLDYWGPIIQQSLDNQTIAQQQVSTYLVMAGNAAAATAAKDANDIDGAIFLANMVPGGAAADNFSQGNLVKGTGWAVADVVLFWAPWAKAGRASARVAGAAVEAESAAASRLPILNRAFTPIPKAVLQNLAKQQSERLAANRLLAKGVLSAKEYRAARSSVEVARMQYGNAVERLMKQQIEADSELRSMFQHWGGPKQPDFATIGRWQGVVFDVSTAAGAANKGDRWYGQMIESIIYQRPSTFTVFP